MKNKSVKQEEGNVEIVDYNKMVKVTDLLSPKDYLEERMNRLQINEDPEIVESIKQEVRDYVAKREEEAIAYGIKLGQLNPPRKEEPYFKKPKQTPPVWEDELLELVDMYQRIGDSMHDFEDEGRSIIDYVAKLLERERKEARIDELERWMQPGSWTEIQNHYLEERIKELEAGDE